jgi:intraflagellar transport protein 46
MICRARRSESSLQQTSAAPPPLLPPLLPGNPPPTPSLSPPLLPFSLQGPRPDGKGDNLGLVTLDEPASIQSDPTVLTLQLRAVSKSSGQQPMLVRSVEHAEKDPKAISGWIHSISDLHRHKPAPSVRYSKPMPDIEALMQIWPAPIEELLEANPLPDADMNMDLATYVRTVCALLDIPVYDKLTESLHVLFTLYSDFKANVHFQQQLASEQQTDGGMDGGGGGGGFESFGEGPSEIS